MIKKIISLAFLISFTHFLNAQCSLSITTTVGQISAPGANDGSVTVTIVGGDAAEYTYVLDLDGETILIDTDTDTTYTFSNLAPGSYEVYGQDRTVSPFCSDIVAFVLSDNPQCANFTATSSKTNETANNAEDGTITVTMQNGTPSYYITLDFNGSSLLATYSDDNSHTFTGLAPGTYDIVVTDTTNECAKILIGIQILVYVPTVSGILNCNGAIPVSCGTAYTGTTSNGANNVEAYACTTWTETGKEKVHTYTPESDGPFGVKLSNYTGDKDVFILSSCNANACIGQLFSDSAYFENGVAGTTYYIVVDDDAGVNGAYTLLVSCEFEPVPCSNFTLNGSSTLISEAGNDGTASYTVLGLTGGITVDSYLWETDETTSSISGLSAGFYSITVTLSNGCILSDSIRVIGQSTCDLLEITAFSGPATSDTSANGIAGVVVEGLVNGETVSYSWNNAQTTQSINGLTPGTYTVTATISNGCTLLKEVTVSVNPTCNLAIDFSVQSQVDSNASDGSITALVFGGSGNYQYYWSTGSTEGNAIANLSPGEYSVTISDATSGCLVIGTARVFSFDNPCSLVMLINQLPPTGLNVTDGGASILVSGGTPPYTYQWNSGATEPIITNLIQGVYVVTVTDSEGCFEVDAFILNVLSTPELPAQIANFNLYPNPVTGDFLNIDLQLTTGMKGAFTLVDVQGKVLLNEQIQAYEVGSFQKSIDISYLKSGYYFVRFSSDMVQIQRPFVVR